MREVKLEITFKVGTLEEVGLGSFKQNWIDTQAPDRPARKFNLGCGAGLGSPDIEASVKDGDQRLYARASIYGLASELFRALGAQLDEPEESDGTPDPPG